ncbi:nicotinate-nucleotide--dimethylbenzimidazole phosphoribosyltransferase [Rhodovibrio salinarum]|uniref:Nicotinate-nucleotide--dimethylbenzimidazole phosphoribosyltransferase n=1 Tax=Rhodovibrio salinarum TaxID=1087 RepID=A0A934QIB8_9PROT|nr:nicotinate-nucleotide--dimethylbenzimidazole phosphoribosyltransferase [Rhodovibrio salinarum]MBK1696975.1 nicotinate-nucleotide--dimethylbenzimidazole phosphoribosyltransferase [Rhodovibrio salinarum]
MAGSNGDDRSSHAGPNNGAAAGAQEAPATFDEIRQLLGDLPGPDLESRSAATTRQQQLTKPRGSLGRLEELAEWLAAWQGAHPPRMDRPRVAVFAGNHGVAARGVSAYPPEVTQQMVQNFIDGGAAINQLCANCDADLRVYELALEEPTADFSQAPAMSEDECARAMAYGMLAVEEGFDVMALGEMGIANTTSGAALCCALFGGTASDWIGPGTGIDRSGLGRKAEVVDQAMQYHQGHLDDPLEVLRRVGGLELAAIVGAILACRLARTPVLLDGFTCTAAAAVLYKLDPHLLDHCVVAHVSAEPGHRRLLQEIGKRALVDLDMRLGEASGAAVAIPLLQAAVSCHAGMATFDEAGVSTPD